MQQLFQRNRDDEDGQLVLSVFVVPVVGVVVRLMCVCVGLFGLLVVDCCLLFLFCLLLNR